jgi:hypothetical protein
VAYYFAESIRAAVNQYYGPARRNSAAIYGINSLVDNWVFTNSGDWGDSNGFWDEGWWDYNCYSYAIEETGSWHLPGDFACTVSFDLDIPILDLALLVQDDLEFLGYYNVYITDEPPNEAFTSSLELDQNLICIRRGSCDFHFMKYDREDGYWYHKPGYTAPLRYKHNNPSDHIWTNESSLEGVEYPSFFAYDSDIYYIVYSMGYTVLPVTERDILGIPVPVEGQLIRKVIIPNDQFTGTVSWLSPPLTAPFPHPTFREMQYVAVITLTAEEGYRFNGVPANSFLVEGAIEIKNAPGSSGKVIRVRAVFPPTIRRVTIRTIPETPLPPPWVIPAPAFIETAQYHGLVSWGFEQRGSLLNYIATIQLSAKNGFTFYGVPANSFNATGAVSTCNAAGTEAGLSVTAVFLSEAFFGGGAGEKGNPFRILTGEHLWNTRLGDEETYYVMENGIELTGVWAPIPEFHGHFNGGELTISGLRIMGEDSPGNYGLFAENRGKIKNLHINPNIHTSANDANVGVIAGINYGTIENCAVFGGNSYPYMIQGFRDLNSNIGGIAGCNAAGGKIIGCFNNGPIYNSSNTGGIAGLNAGIIKDCSNHGRIDYYYHIQNSSIGGIAGVQVSGKIFQSSNGIAQIVYMNSYSDSRTLQPCMGGVLGWLQGGEYADNGMYNMGGSVIESGSLTTVTWLENGVPRSHDQAFYAVTRQIGRQ